MIMSICSIMTIDWWIELSLGLSITILGIYLIIRNHRNKRNERKPMSMPLYKDDYEYLECLKNYLATADWDLGIDDSNIMDMYRNPTWLIGEIERVERKIADENIFE